MEMKSDLMVDCIWSKHPNKLVPVATHSDTPLYKLVHNVSALL